MSEVYTRIVGVINTNPSNHKNLNGIARVPKGERGYEQFALML